MYKIKVPILMYHEIFNEESKICIDHKMTPAYNISEKVFEEQVRYLSGAGYTGITFSEIDNIIQYPDKKKGIVLTFDDGWLGNYKMALPILNRYNFKAVFFVTGAFIGRPDFMTWEQLKELVGSGMLVQPHGMSHKPLQNLDLKSLYWELFESKKMFEKNLGVNVFSMSFPHGSYNNRVLKMGAELGYRIMCTSELTRNYSTDFLFNPSIIGRITIHRSLKLDKFEKFINYNKLIYTKYKIFEKFKKNIKLIIGIENYRKIYRAYYKISSPAGYIK